MRESVAYQIILDEGRDEGRVEGARADAASSGAEEIR